MGRKLTWSRPGLLNSLSGLLTVLIGVYTSPSGAWSETAYVAIGVSALCLCYTLVGFAVYQFWLLENVKQQSQQ